MKKLALLIAILIITSSCSHFNDSVALNVGYGRDTSLANLGKTNGIRSYKISDISIEFIEDYDKWSTSLELSIVDHRYKDEDIDRLNRAISYSSKLWLIRNFRYDTINIFAGVGMGFGYINPIDDNKYLADTHLVSDLGVRAGIQKSFERFSIRLEYMFRHFSGIWRSDSGENEDEIRVGIVIPFNK